MLPLHTSSMIGSRLQASHDQCRRNHYHIKVRAKVLTLCSRLFSLVSSKGRASREDSSLIIFVPGGFSVTPTQKPGFLRWCHKITKSPHTILEPSRQPFESAVLFFLQSAKSTKNVDFGTRHIASYRFGKPIYSQINIDNVAIFKNLRHDFRISCIRYGPCLVLGHCSGI